MTQLHEVSIVARDRGLVESPRWHDGQFWFADWTAGEILSIDDQGACQGTGSCTGTAIVL